MAKKKRLAKKYPVVQKHIVAQQNVQERLSQINTTQLAVVEVPTQPILPIPPSRKARRIAPWLIVGTILLVCALIGGGGFFYLTRAASNRVKPPSFASTWKTLTSISPAIQTEVDTGNAKSTMKAIPVGAKIPLGATGKPLFLYEGAEFCPYCAGMRWPIIVSLSRFGTFSQLQPILSSESNVPSYTFYKATYTSKYIDFVSLETSDNDGQVLQTPNAVQQKLIDTYNAPPFTGGRYSIPFLLIANQVISTGPYYDPFLLAGSTQQQITDQLKQPNSIFAQAILGSANYLTAAICQATHNQPKEVCSSGHMPQIQQALPQP